ncbi:MAG TPA: hypothetical protein QGF35_00845 [Dehalococcoidia bacterium]|nr:hypothetical protein [Dehalococcoidia bacterium]
MAPPSAESFVIALDRWGRALVFGAVAPDVREGSELEWRVPGATIESGESPDETALRTFEEITGEALDRLGLFRVYWRDGAGALRELLWHVYFDDPDLALEDLLAAPGLQLGYCDPREPSGYNLVPAHRQLMTDFASSTAYRTLFH